MPVPVVAHADQRRAARSGASVTRSGASAARSGSGVAQTRPSRKGCHAGKGYTRPRRYVPSNDATVSDRPATASGERRDCRARHYCRGLSPYTTTSSDRSATAPNSASTSNRPARARQIVTPTDTQPTSNAPTEKYRSSYRPITDSSSPITGHAGGDRA